jgi:hypothetical protein
MGDLARGLIIYTSANHTHAYLLQFKDLEALKTLILAYMA